MNRNYVNFKGFLAVFCSVVFLVSCATTKSPDESGGVAKIKIVASDTINPSSSSTPSPVVVKFFQLKDDQIFNRSDFFGLYLHPKQTLGDDYVSEKEVMMAPGETKEIRLMLNGNAHYLAVLAAYQNIDQAKWSDVKKIDTFWGSMSVDVTLNHDDIALR